MRRIEGGSQRRCGSLGLQFLTKRKEGDEAAQTRRPIPLAGPSKSTQVASATHGFVSL